MTGRILGYDSSNNTGTISGDDSTRYKFSNEDWRDDTPPQKEMKVDFETGDENCAKDIYLIRDKEAENSSTLLGLVAVGITFFFGFIGTFVSRLFIAKEPIGSALIATAIHFLITLLVFIPILGWLLFMIGSGYFMYKNFILVTQEKQ